MMLDIKCEKKVYSNFILGEIQEENLGLSVVLCVELSCHYAKINTISGVKLDISNLLWI